MKRLKEMKGLLAKWAPMVTYAFGVLTVAWPARAFAAVRRRRTAVGRAAHDFAERPAGSGRSRDHHRGDHRHRDHVVGE